MITEGTETDLLLHKYAANCNNHSTTRNELKIITFNALPLTVTYFLQSSITSVPLLFAGRLGIVELGGVAIANVTFIVSTAAFIGLCTSLDTLCPQAYGAKKYKLVGLYFQRCMILAALVSVPICLAWFFSGYLLKGFIEDVKVVSVASRYLRLLILAVPGVLIFECGKKYFQAQNNFTKGRNIILICAPINVLMNYLLVSKLDIGYIGSAYSLIATYTLMGFLIVFSVYSDHEKAKTFGDGPDCWHEISIKMFHGWKPMLKLAVPGFLMVEAEFLAFELLTILSAKFGATALAAQSVATSIQSLTFQIPFSVGVAASNRIAFHIGQSKVRNCTLATRCTLTYLGSAIILINFSLLTFGRGPISRFYSNDPEVIKQVKELLPIIGINQFPDIINVLSAGCLRAQGRQSIGGYLSVSSYYFLALPLAFLLAFKYKLGTSGLWIGLGIGILVLALLELWLVLKSNWLQIIKASQSLHTK